MLSKKAIAAFAAVATFVSGIAFAMPALASSATPVPVNSGGKSAKLSPLETLKKRVNDSGLFKSEIDEILDYVNKNESKVTGRRDDSENNAVVNYVNSKIVKYRAMHLDVIGLHDLAKQVREANDFKSASDIFFGANGKPATKDDRDKAQSAYVNGKAALVKKAKDEGLTLVANKIKESNYNSLSSLEDSLNEAEKYAKEDLVKQAKAKGFNFTATLISKAATLNGARALLNEAQKTITDTLVKSMADLGISQEDFQKALKESGKSATPSQLELFKKEAQEHRNAQEKPYANAVEVAQLVDGGTFTPTEEEKAAATKFLNSIKDFANKPFDKLTTAEANKAGAAAVEFNNKISAALKKSVKEYKEYNEEKEDLAKQAEEKGLRFTAKIIRDSKKSRLVSLENLLAEAKKSKNSEHEKNPGASGDNPADNPAEKAPSAPSTSDFNATQDSSAEHGLAKTESSEKTAQAKAVVPAAPKSVNDLKPELKGTLKVGSNNIAVAGSANKVFVNVNNKAFLDRLHSEGSVRAYAFMYSTPKLLRSVDGSDYVTVKLGADGVPYFDAQFPAGYSGKHTVVLVDEQGNQLAWTDITVVNNAAGQSDGKGVLPVTGAAGVLVAFAALMFAASGAVLRKVRS